MVAMVIMTEPNQSDQFGLVSRGDQMWSVQLGECEVDLLMQYSNHIKPDFREVRVRCVNKHGMSLIYGIDGKLVETDENVSLFKTNPFKDIENNIFPRIMSVWDNFYSLKKEKLVYGKFGKRYLASDIPEKYESVDDILLPVKLVWWGNAEEAPILKIKTITKSELAKIFRVDIVTITD